MIQNAKQKVSAAAKAFLRSAFWLIPHRSFRRTVLLICSGSITADYLAEIWHVLKVDPRLRFRLLLRSREERPGSFEYIRKTLPVKEIASRWATLFKWDLMILADHGGEYYIEPRRCPVLRLLHGIPGKLVNGENYAFGRGAYDSKGRILYTRLFVSSMALKDLAVSIDPAFKEVVAVVGSLGDDRILAETCRREEYRRQLGLRPKDTAVLVTSTYGPNSLFQRMGDALLAEARRLQPEFRFILSAHPLEYRSKRPGERVWGEYLRTQAEHGFIIREPSEHWIPYLIACDIVLADHTAVAMHSPLLGRPVVYVPTPEGAIEKGSVVDQLRAISPVIREDASDLREGLLKAVNSYPRDKMLVLAGSLNSFPGEAAMRIREETYAMLRLPCPPVAPTG